MWVLEYFELLLRIESNKQWSTVTQNLIENVQNGATYQGIIDKISPAQYSPLWQCIHWAT